MDEGTCKCATCNPVILTCEAAGLNNVLMLCRDASWGRGPKEEKAVPAIPEAERTHIGKCLGTKLNGDVPKSMCSVYS